MAGIERVGQRLTVVQQISRGSGELRGRPLAVTAIYPEGGRFLRAADIFPLQNLSAARAYGLGVRTPAGLLLSIEDLVGKSAAAIDELAQGVDAIAALSASRALEFPLPTYVSIQAGSFPVKGSGLFGIAQPSVARVTITQDFEIGKTKVTVAQFAAFVQAINYEITGQGADELKARLADLTKQDHPVNFVDRNQDVAAYLEWLNKVDPGYVHFIPTAAQHEYARRGQEEGRLFPWGNEWDPAKVVSFHNSPDDTQPVDFATGATPEGMRDHGNLWEWASTLYGDYAPTDTKDPRGPDSGIYDAEVRGGSFNGGIAVFFHGAFRNCRDPSRRYGGVGFRVARTSIK